MTPDYQNAATAAVETLIKYGIDSAPVSPLAILKRIPNVLVISYEALSKDMDQSRECVMDMVGDKNQDAFTTVSIVNGQPHYIVTYNQMLPYFLAQRALARELGHIVLGHDGSRTEEVRQAESKTFAHHLLCPRPLIHAIQAIGLRFTVEVLGNLTGCYDYCLTCMRRVPGVSVPAELNRRVREQFMPFITNYYKYQLIATHKDGSALADFGTYMDGYEE